MAQQSQPFPVPFVRRPRDWAFAAAAVIAAVWLLVWAFGAFGGPADSSSAQRDLVLEAQTASAESVSVRYIVGDDDVTETAERVFTEERRSDVDHVQLIVQLPALAIDNRTVSCRVSVDGSVVIERSSDTGFVDCTTEIGGAAAE
ncbi:hypothetical protein [Leucobacter japonicus]|uniref:hypothetical protein n=1 Tax=Leucobacter japonicus TaxID=1461259 RepID=UPI000AA9DAD6|nr:hypothetical protein [Leucobacter japonicus]